MSRRTDSDECDDDDWDDDDSSDGDSTVACPYCQREIFEDALRCPYCENYISAEDSRPVPKTRFIIFGTLVALAVIAWWVMH